MTARVRQVIELYVEHETYAKQRTVTRSLCGNSLKFVTSKADRHGGLVTPELRVDAS